MGVSVLRSTYADLSTVNYRDEENAWSMQLQAILPHSALLVTNFERKINHTKRIQLGTTEMRPYIDRAQGDIQIEAHCQIRLPEAFADREVEVFSWPRYIRFSLRTLLQRGVLSS